MIEAKKTKISGNFEKGGVFLEGQESMKPQPLGKQGELLAANYLIAQGYTLLEANYMNRRGYRVGELDIIAKDPDGQIVFVEVKSLRGTKEGALPEANLTNQKLRKIIKAANHFLRKRQLWGAEWRIDLVAIVFDFSIRKSHLRHIKAIRY